MPLPIRLSVYPKVFKCHNVLEPVPKFGSTKGLITIADDFDEPIEGFEEYAP